MLSPRWLKWVKTLVFTRNDRNAPRRKRVSPFRPLLESLEDRTLPSVTALPAPGGGQIITATGTSGDDTYTLRLDPTGQTIQVWENAPTTDPPTFTAALAGVTQIDVNALDGADRLIVDSSNGLINVPDGIRYDGGGGFDGLTVQQTGGPTLTSDAYAVGPAQGMGTSTLVGPSGAQTIAFQNIEPMLDTAPAATVTVTGTNAANSINYTQGSVAANGLVSVDNQEPIEFSNKTNLIINGLAGSDTINLNNPNTPAGLTGTITVNGGDPTASDTLIVNGIGGGALDNLRYLPTAVGAGTVVNDNQPQPNVNFTGIEHLTLVVQQTDGDGVRVDGTTGNDAIEFFHGLTSDSGSFVGTMDQNNATGVGPFTMTPMSYTGVSPLDNDLDVNFFNAGGTDSFVFNATASDDNIVVTTGEAGGTEFRNTLNGIIVARPEVFNVASALVRTLEGNDTIQLNLPAGPAATTLRVEGGSGDNVLNYNAPTGAATTIDLGASSITSTAPAGNPVTYAGIATVNEKSSGAGSTLTVTGTAGDDNFQVQPTGAGAGNFVRQGVGGSPQFTYTGVGGAVTFGGGPGGFDILTILGDEGVDTVTATATTVTRAGGAITAGANLDRLDVNTFGSNDTITLTTFAALPTRIDAGDGDDQVSGSTQVDLIFGGQGNDFLVGGGGNDVIHGGDGDDRFGDPLVRDPAANDPGNDQFFGEGGSDAFFWDPGDGDDLVEGGAGDSDQIFFSGNAGAEQFFLFADTITPSRFHLFRVQAAIDIDAADVEEVNLTTLGGADTVTVGRSDLGVLSDLSTTTVRAVDVSLGADGAADNVIFEGRPLDDNLLVSISSGSIKVAGLSYDMRIDGADAALDRLTVNGNEGNDTVKANPGVEAAIQITLNGGDGNDYLSADAIINGNDGNDILVGGAGNDTMDGGAGDDTFIGNGGTDAVNGGLGSSVGDTILVQGTTGGDTITLALNASGHLLATVNGLTTTYTNFLAGPIATSGIEHIEADGLAGNDTFNVTPLDTVTISADGGDPTGPPGDALNLDLTGVTNPQHFLTDGPPSFSGTWSFGNRASVTFTSFESLSPIASISGQKFNDLNGDGSVVGDPGVGGVTIQLIKDVNDNSIPDDAVFATAVTAAGTGAYSFPDLDPVRYFVQEVVPAGAVQTAGPAFYTVDGAAGGDFPGRDFGNFTLITISGRKFNDIDGNGTDNGGADPGVGGVTIQLIRDANNNGLNDDAVFAATMTAAGAGAYSFPNVGPGRYFVQEVLPAGSTQTTPAGGFYTVVASSGVNVVARDFGNNTPPADIVITGSNGDDTLILTRTPGGVPGSITYVLNGGAPVMLTNVHSFTFNGLDGNDTMTVSKVNGGPLVPGDVHFDGGPGANTLIVDAVGAVTRETPGDVTFGDPQNVTYSNVSAININNAAAIGAIPGPDTADRGTAFAGLTAQERFVQALYLAALGRAGTTAELDGWVALFNTPGQTQALDQFAIAAGIEHSAEARDHLVQSWYVTFLGRPASGGEEQVWVNALQAGQTEETVLSGILASTEFYNRAQTLIPAGSADERYVQALYLLLLNRTGEAAAVSAWVGALPGGRQGVALAFLTGPEFRTDQFEAYYNALHRPDDAAGLNGWVFSNLDMDAVRIGFASTSEFFTNG